MAVIQINTNPSRRQLNLFGVIWLVFFSAVGAVLRLKGHPLTTSAFLWGLGVTIPLLGWGVPAFMRLVYLGMSYLAWPIGLVISHVILAAVYYLIFTPVALILRLLGHDAMARRFDPEAGTYWRERAEAGMLDPRRYFRQF